MMETKPPAGLKLVRPEATSAGAPLPSADQGDVIGLPAGCGPVLVLGGPGTGKTTALVEHAVRRVQETGLDPAGLLFMAPNRLAASRLRDALTARLDRSLGTSPARTWSAYAFDLIRRARVEGLLPLVERAPRLLSGPEQDQIIAELLAGHRAGYGQGAGWPEDLQQALATRGFRQEIRQLFDRLTEYGSTAAQLELLGAECGRPDWTAAARLYREYRDLIDLRMPEAFDPAGIITSARQLLLEHPGLLERERSRLQLILADDLQEANPAVFELLALLVEGQDALLAASPDTVVQGFRGARPDVIGKLPGLLGTREKPLRTLVLTTSHRMVPAVAAAWQSTAARISQVAGAHRARELVHPAPRAHAEAAPGAALRAGAPSASAHVVASPVHEHRYVAQRILEARLFEGYRLSEMAVIVRTGGQLSALARYLTGQDIAVKVPVAETAVRDEAAVRPLLDALAMALDPDLLTADSAVSLLTSRLGGATAIDLRRLRQALRREELLGGGGRSSDALLVEALGDAAFLSTLGREGGAARRVARMLQAGREAAAAPGANAETVLWALWSAAGLADRWAAQALQGGPAGVRADRDLDAMMALFQTAERYVDQLPGSSPRQFLEYLLNQELPMDNLAPRAQLREAVELLTPASAAGRGWPLVIVAGVQEGVWPNTRLRGELLGSTQFVDVLEHGVEEARRIDAVARLREIRYDELRSFSTAISRAERRLICTAVQSEDAQPSQFLDLVDPWLDPETPRPPTEVLRPRTVRALAAELRQAAQQATDRPEPAADAAAVLAMLAASPVPVPGAHPRDWWGLLPLSSTAPVVPEGEPVPVSPSKVEAVQKSPLDWFIQAAGGEAATDFARSLGTLVHGIAQDFPDGTGTEYVAELVRRWPQLGMKENWEGQLDFNRAEGMVRRLAQYVVQMRAEGRSLVGVEQDFSVDLQGPERVARLRGQVDRLELDADGRLHIVDLKTGRSAPTKADLERHPQLGSYQAAVQAGGFSGQQPAPGGASLVQLGQDLKTVKVQQQDSLADGEDWATPMIHEAAALMSAAQFEARHDPQRSRNGGHGCRAPEICPLCAEGKQVTE
ncbi:ATP-dependent helicase [Arthrobacter sp. CAU 1506]|uniref:ATP-dependent helicase n=1 Tax=Arthrobacter sp. CAU 1506 TaxID=2560052 RepID=UPI0010AB8E7B|nr:ATP-dependent DNA helicase [Arthrobacter sp. CAU 1506]TJY71305.1 ATP-dependent helicase [Arthrobacter sp. CAU 1506]